MMAIRPVAGNDPHPDSGGGARGGGDRGPPVAVHPPVAFALVVAIGLALDWALHALGWRAVTVAPAWLWAGRLLVALGLLGAGLTAWRMWRAKTAVPTFGATMCLVTDGPFRFSRNPIYAGLVLILAGLALSLLSVGLALLLPVLVLVLHHGVIRREEVYLQELFGEAYRAYCARTPRWLGRPRELGEAPAAPQQPWTDRH